MEQISIIVKLSVRLQLKSSLCYYSDAHILVYRTIATTEDAGPPAERTQTQTLTTRQSFDRNESIIFNIMLHLLVAWAKLATHKQIMLKTLM